MEWWIHTDIIELLLVYLKKLWSNKLIRSDNAGIQYCGTVLWNITANFINNVVLFGMEFKAWIPLNVSFKVKGRDVIVDIQQSVSFLLIVIFTWPN